MVLDALHGLALGEVLPVDVNVLPGAVDHVEHGAGEAAVALGAVARLIVGLGDLQAPGFPREAHEDLGAGSGRDEEGLEARGHPAGGFPHLLPGGAQQLGVRPRVERGVGAVRRLGLGPLVHVCQEHMACGDVLVLAPARAVVPAAREHGRIESGGAVAVPHGGGKIGIGHGRFGVRSRGGGGGGGVRAVGDVAVRRHMGGEIPRVGDAVPDGHLDVVRFRERGERAREHRRGCQKERKRAAQELLRRDLSCLLIHLFLLSKRGCLGPKAGRSRGAWFRLRCARCRLVPGGCAPGSAACSTPCALPPGPP